MADASTQCYFLDAARNQQGPVPLSEIARLVRNGTINRDTLVWIPGMPDWRPAGQVGDLAAMFAPPSAARQPPAPGGMRASPMGMGAPSMGMGAPMAAARQVVAGGPAGAPDALVPNFPVWGLFWRALLTGFGSAFIIPAPWLMAMLYGFIIGNTSLPNGRRLTFAGTGGDIWLFILGPLIAYVLIAVLGVFIPFLALLNLLVMFAIMVLVPYLLIRWVVDKTGAEDGSLKLTFTGSMWGLLGWNLLFALSMVTIVGWAWVLAATMRWMCRNVSGTHKVEFAGTGLEVLWRSIVYVLCSYLIIPIPWMLRWYHTWFISQIRVADAHA